MKYRRALVSDAAALAAVERTQPQAAGWGEAGFIGELPQACAVIWCAEENGQVIGFIAARAAADSAEILNVAVQAGQLRRGIAKALLREVLNDLKEQGVRHVTLEVAQDNLPACALYKQAGFAMFNTRKDFYGPGRHAWLLGKEL
ncbi:MAG: GNAT family N-acetyltransferase [Elusimicrobiaceae bacterium]|nr:GNAT family N-acetyltransferase [Elusimicrobiaceae bacterium]